MYIDNHPYKLLAETKKCQNGFHVKAYTFYLEINTKTLHLGHYVRTISKFTDLYVLIIKPSARNLGRHFRFGVIRPKQYWLAVNGKLKIAA